jgi:cytochrome c oxidase cbb3-type subunit 2
MASRRVLAIALATGVLSTVLSVAPVAGEAVPGRGAELYATYCAGCHGDAGDGRGPAADMLIVKPRDFTKGVFKFRSTPTGELPTDADLYRTITNGAYGTSMPAWPLLTEVERHAVIEFIKGFYPGWRTEGPGTPIHIPPVPAAVGSAQSVARGRELYEMLDCAQCHGAGGRGDGPSSVDLDPDIWGNPQKPFDFTQGRLRGGPDVADIYRTFMTGIGGTAMPSYASIFDEPDDEYIFDGDAWNLVSYVLSLRRGGAEGRADASR